MSSIDWVCEYRECDIVFKRYPSYVKRNTKRYCSQSHASYEQAIREKEEIRSGKRKPRKLIMKECLVCKSPTSNRTVICKQCQSINTSWKHLNFTAQDYYNLYEKQEGKCCICKSEYYSVNKKDHRLAIDHDHNTGKIRGLLCLHCNTRLEWLEKYIEDALEYINK